jgi:hypothetical protein
MNFFDFIAAILISAATLISGLGVKKIPTPMPSYPMSTSVAVTPTETPAPTVSTAPKVFVPTASPTIKLTPTVDPALVSSCATATLPLKEFAGIGCISSEQNYRWMFGAVNGKPATDDIRDDAMVARGGEGLKNDILRQCYKSTKERFEICNSSMRDQSGRLREELIRKYDSDIQNCINGAGGDKGVNARYFAKERMRDRINELYDFCYSHNNSVTEYHF